MFDLDASDLQTTRLIWSLLNSLLKSCDWLQKVRISCLRRWWRRSVSLTELLTTSDSFQQGCSNLLTSSRGCYLISCANVLLCSSAGSFSSKLNCSHIHQAEEFQQEGRHLLNSSWPRSVYLLLFSIPTQTWDTAHFKPKTAEMAFVLLSNFI